MTRQPAEALPLESPGTDLQTVQPDPVAQFAQVIERLAANPNVDVVKLEKIIDLNERILKINAKNAFEAAYSRMQPEIPEVDEKGQLVVKGTLRSRYARLEDIQSATKPILAKHGFALRHRTEWPTDKPGIIRIVGILSHEQGHSEESVFESKSDASEYRTDIQSMGSTVSYGRRYTTIDLLNIVTRGVDNDGQTAGRPAPPDKAEGGTMTYAEWVEKLEAQAEKGQKAFEPAWESSDAHFKTYMANHDKEKKKQLMATAAKRRG